LRLAVISDIHGNLVALDAVIDDLRQSGAIDHLWVLGDLATFGPRPAECIQRVRALPETLGLDEKKFEIISGNHDRYLVTGARHPKKPAEDADKLKELADEWSSRDQVINWTLEQLSFEDYDYLRKLRHDLSLDAPDYGWVIGYHAVPGDDEGVLKPDTPAEEAEDYLLDREGRLGIGGHIHQQMDRQLQHWRVINAGSVGAPKTDKRAEYAIITFENGEAHIDLRHVRFDVDTVMADLKHGPLADYRAVQMNFVKAEA